MMKKRCLRFAVFLCVIFMMTLGGCKFNEPLKAFFEKYTDMSYVTGHRFGSAMQVDKNGYQCISSLVENKIYLDLHNPQGYELEFDMGYVDGTPENEYIKINQIDDSTAVITIPKDKIPEHTDLSTTIKIKDSLSGREFMDYSLKVKVNTPPPPITDATVMLDVKENNIICFNLPQKDALTGIHKDLSEIEISGNDISGNKKVKIKVGADGSVSISDTSVTNFSKSITEILSKNENLNEVFSANQNPFYCKTNQRHYKQDVKFAIRLYDEGGLSSKSFYTTSFTDMAGKIIYVADSDNDGSDENNGTKNNPYATLQKAMEIVNSLKIGVNDEFTIKITGTINTKSETDITSNKELKLTITGTQDNNSKDKIVMGANNCYIFKIGNTGSSVTEVEFKNISITGANVTGTDKYGGAINAGKNTNVIFDNVHAYNNKGMYGGVIYSDGNVTLQNKTVFGDSTKTSAPTSELAGGNSASHNGGAIRIAGNLVIKRDCYVAYNYCQGIQYGGGISVQGSGNVTVDEGAFVQYNYCGGNGGGIYVGNETTGTTSTITINGNIIGNKAYSSGGGIYIANGRCKLIIGEANGSATATVEISGNNAGSDGGGIYNDSGSVTVNPGVTITNNKASHGGGIYCTGSSNTLLTMNGGSITKNNAKNGAGIWNKTGKLIFGKSGGTATVEISENKTITEYFEGGGIFNRGGKVEIYPGVTIKNNEAKIGGGIYNKKEGSSIGTITIAGGEITGNKAEYSGSTGGGIYNLDGTVTITGGEISSNTSAQDGGGIYNTGTVKIGGGASAVSITENTATTNGVGIYNNGVLRMGGAVNFGADDDIYLPGGKTITITGNLTHSVPVAKIKLSYYAAGITVLDGDASLVKTNNTKFSLSNNAYYINSIGNIAEPIQVSDSASLKTELANISNGDIIELTADCTNLEPVSDSYSNTGNFTDGKNYVVEIPKDVAVTIKGKSGGTKIGNGKSVQSGNLFKVYGTVVLENIVIDGSTTNLHWATIEVSGGSLTLNDCTIQDISTRGTLAGIINIEQGGEFIMNGGSIINNSTNGRGGVTVTSTSSFTNNRGTITGNLSKGQTVDVYTVSGATYINKGGTVDVESLNNTP